MRPALIFGTAVACALGVACRRAARETPQQSASQTLAAGNHTITIRHGGRSREYIVHVPRGTAGARPVLFAFHGGGGEAAGFQDYAGLDAVADREAVVVVYPFGSGPLPRRLLTWNAGECCGYAMNQNVDDVGFAIAVLDDLGRRTSIDQRRVYATGHSNGAMMSYRLGAERADRIAAIVPVAGSYDMARFAPSRPVALLHIHSIDDPRALYNGGLGPPFPGTNVRSSHRPVMDGVNQWLRNNGCATQPRTSESRAGRAGTVNEGQTATLLTWDGCASSAPVAHWKLAGVGHAWPGNERAELREEIIGRGTTLVVAAEELWRFVSPIRR